MKKEGLFSDFDFSTDPEILDLLARIDFEDVSLIGRKDVDFFAGLDLPVDPDLVARMNSELSQWKDEIRALPKRVAIFQCPDCDSYFQPQLPDDPPNRKRWITAEPQSTELLTFCVRRLKPYLKPLTPKSGHLKLRLSDPHFTPGSSATIAVTIHVLKDFPTGIIHHCDYSVEYDVHHKTCDSCCSIRGTSDQSCSAKGKDDLEQQLSNLNPFVTV